MATRFYFDPSITPSITPGYDAVWNQTGSASRGTLVRKANLSQITTLADISSISIPITTTQTILARQFISDPIPAQRLQGNVTLCIRCVESATTSNAFLYYNLALVSLDGTLVQFGGSATDTEFGTTAATRIVPSTNSPFTSVTTKVGDRLIIEVGASVAAPSAGSTTFAMRFGNSAATDFALTTALTTDLNPWIEFSQDIFGTVPNNYQSVKVGDGMSTGERIR